MIPQNKKLQIVELRVFEIGYAGGFDAKNPMKIDTDLDFCDLFIIGE